MNEVSERSRVVLDFHGPENPSTYAMSQPRRDSDRPSSGRYPRSIKVLSLGLLAIDIDAFIENREFVRRQRWVRAVLFVSGGIRSTHAPSVFVRPTLAGCRPTV